MATGPLFETISTIALDPSGEMGALVPVSACKNIRKAAVKIAILLSL
jgi:hypothetical protein